MRFHESSHNRRRLVKRFLSYEFLIPVAIIFGLAPFVSEPHLIGKLRMLAAGELSRPIDIFDLVLHGLPLFLLGIRVVYDVAGRMRGERPGSS